MKKLILFSFLAALTFFSQPAKAQGLARGMPKPPPSQQTPVVSTSDPVQTPLGARIDLVELQREADELARTAQSIPGDVGNIRKGMLPKDVLVKLKQIEKLSKRLRSELTP